MSEATEPAQTCTASRLLGMSRGFSCLFWGMPVLAVVHALAFNGLWPARWLAGILLVSYLPVICGLGRLRKGGEPTERWRKRVGWVGLAALLAMGLSPFLAWWSQSPLQVYFAVNAAVFHLAQLVLLVGVNRLAWAGARWMDDTALRREAWAGIGMVLWLSSCTVLALAWLFHQAGVLEAGWPTVLMQLTQLPREARTLFLLPYAMTAYVMWRAKETGFKRAMKALNGAG